MIQDFRQMIRACGKKSYLMKRAVALSALSSIIQGLIYTLVFWVFIALFNNDSVWPIVVSLCCLAAIEGALRLLATYLDWIIYLEVADVTRADLGEQLKKIPLESLTSRRTGDLNQILTSNVQEVVSIAGGIYTVVVNTIVAPSTTIIAMTFIDWRIALAMLIIFPLSAPLHRASRRINARSNRTVSAAHAETASEIIEYAQGLAVLRATRQVGKQSKRLNESIERLRKIQVSANQALTLPSILFSAMFQLGIVAVVMLAVYWALGGALGVAVVLALVAVTIRLSEPLALFTNNSGMFDFMNAAIARINALMDIQPLPTTQSAIEPTSAEVQLSNVTFSYLGSTDPVLRNVSCTFANKSMTALVGSSGSGKTTITKLICRYADPLQGEIRIGGVNIRSLSQSELMSHISVVFQDVYLFDDSVLENIRMAKPNATDEEVEQSARSAGCHDFVSKLPKGYHTPVGEIGSALSGGERQRISIARAILKDAPIVILDEPTSALDTANEVAVQQAIEALVRDKTVIVIAHRLSTIVAADNIIVLEAGQVVEQGTHTQLVESSGRYAQLWQAQQSSRRWRITS